MVAFLRNGALTGGLVLCAAVIGGRPLGSARQEPCNLDKGPLTLGGIKDALDAVAAGVRIDVAGYITRCGATFILDEAGAAELRAIGAKPELIALLMPPSGAPIGAPWTPLTDRREMRWVGSGSFLMGSPEGEAGRKDDEKAHSVTLRSGFWLDSAEVTNEAYLQFVKAQPQWSKGQVVSVKDYLKDWTDIGFPVGAARTPVTYVNWQAARAYAKWAGKRLPTEAEWEYAARAGTRTAYWWGANSDADRANSTGELWPVDEVSSRNPWGFFNTLGNAWEWTSSLYGEYPYDPGDGRETADGGGPRVVRGGGFGQQRPANLRAANRAQLDPARAFFNVGFRCAYGQ